MNQPVTTGVIALAGFGTRFLPITKSTPKEMLPIVDKPIVQYIVEEMVASGITEIIFIVSSHQKPTLEQYFGSAPILEAHLKSKGKARELSEIQKLSTLAKFEFVVQKDMDKFYGTGAAVRSAAQAVGNRPFVLALGDDLVKSPVPFAKQLIAAYQENSCSVIGADEVPASETHRYGIIETKPESSHITKIIEKPQPGETNSTLAIVGRYLLTPEVFGILEDVEPNHLGEVCLTSAFDVLLEKSAMVACKIDNGKWYTTGDPRNYFRALIAYAQDQPDLQEELKNFFKNK